MMTTLISILVGLSISSCTEDNIDSPTEVSCSQAHGLWTVMRATCDGTATSNVAPVTFVFDRDERTSLQSTGRVDCASLIHWSVEMGLESALYSMTGTGSLTCTQNGVEVDFCHSDVNSCNSAIPVAGLFNQYPTCVIVGDEMSLMRNVSPVNNPDGLSYCDDGQSEVVTLIQGEYVPPDPDSDPNYNPDLDTAFIEIVGTNPKDFGSHPVGSRENLEVTITNSGTGVATAINPVGLQAPFSFFRENFPGDGGTCTQQLDPGASCTMVLEFFSQSEGYFTDNLLIYYANGIRETFLNLSLAATSSQDLAILRISDGPYYDFGVVAPGASAVKALTITNWGGGDASAIEVQGVSEPFAFTGGEFPGLGGTCDVTLVAGADCLIEVEFLPSIEGPFSATIKVPYYDGLNSRSVDRNIFGFSAL